MKKILVLLLLLSAELLKAAAVPAAPPPENFKPRTDIRYSYGRGWLDPPLPGNTTKLLVTVFGFKHNVQTELGVEVMERAFYYKPVTLNWGSNRFIVEVADFKPKVPYDIDWNFSHAVQFFVPRELGEVRSVQPVAASRPRKWYQLPDPVPPKKTIDGKVWTEGLSFTGLGRYPNSQRAENLTETVFSDSFQVLLSDTDRCNFLLKPQVPENTGFRETVEIDFIKRVVTNTGSNGETVKLTASNAFPGFLIDSSVPLEILYTGLQKSKVIEGYVGEDTTDFIKYAIKHNLDPAQRKNFRCHGIYLPGAEGLADPAILKEVDFAKLAEPWLVMLWKLPGNITAKSYWKNTAQYAAVLVTCDGKAVFGDGSIKLSKGTIGISSAFNNVLPERLNYKKLHGRASMLARSLRKYPVQCREFYRVTASDIFIRNEFRYRAWGRKEFQAPDYAPVPTVLAANYAFSQNMDLPVTPRMIDHALATMHGPYTSVRGNVLNYSIKRLPFDHALPPAVPEFRIEAEQAEFVMKKTTEFPGKGRAYKPYREVFVMDAGGHRVMVLNNLLCWGSYDETVRKQMLDLLRTGIERACSEHLWLPRKEMHTRRPYLLNGWPADVVDAAGGRYYQGDANTMNSSVWFAVYMYGKYSGDWEYVRKKMPLLKSLYLYDEMVNAWDNPGPSGRDHIHLTEIDMDTISAMGLGALEKIAHQLGDKAFEERVAYVRAKSLNCIIAKVVFDRWLLRENDPRRENAVMRGFFANFVNFKEFDKIPALDRISTEPTWSNWFTTQPELPLLLSRAIRTEFIKAYQEKLLRIFPVFTEFPAKEHRNPWDVDEMIFNSLEVLLALGEYERAEQLHDDWFKQLLDGKNPHWYPHWKGATIFNASYIGVIARMRAARYGFELRDWEPAVLKTFRLDPQTMTVELELESPRDFTLRFRSRYSPELAGVVQTAPEEYSLKCKAGKSHWTIPLKNNP